MNKRHYENAWERMQSCPANWEFENSLSEHTWNEICIWTTALISRQCIISSICILFSCEGLSTGPKLEDNNGLHLAEVLTYPRHHLLIEVIKDVTQLSTDLQEWKHKVNKSQETAHTHHMRMSISGVMTVSRTIANFPVITAINVRSLTALNSYLIWANLWYMSDWLETGVCERELKWCFVNWLSHVTISSNNNKHKRTLKWYAPLTFHHPLATIQGLSMKLI